MSILFYHAPGKGGEIENIFKVVGLDQEVEVYLDIPAILNRIARESYSISAVLLQVSTREELDAFIARQDLLDGLRVIVAPDGCGPELISRIHTLFPRYISLQNPHFGDIEEVLKKMYAQRNAKTI